MYKISIFLLFCLTFLTSCAKLSSSVITDSEQVFIIPANTQFNAKVDVTGPTKAITRDKDTWCADAGKMIELEEKANQTTLSK